MDQAEWPQIDELEAVFRSKFGNLSRIGWGPRRRHKLQYYTPDDYYEAAVARLVQQGDDWLDVGGGRDIFPGNPGLARELVARCRRVVAVDPSGNVHENEFVTERVQAPIETYATQDLFDVASMRMVAEHIAKPREAMASLARLLKPGGHVIIFTVNRWSPASIMAKIVPHSGHFAIKKFVWGGEEKDTFPVSYLMNTRAHLDQIMADAGFAERRFAYVDDCRTSARFFALNWIEMQCWRSFNLLGLRYPENCLLGLYEKTAAS